MPPAFTAEARAVNANMVTSECSTDYVQAMRDKFADSPYLLQVYYADEDCTDLAMALVYPATGTCVGAYNESDSLYVVATLHKNSSALVQQYLDRSCTSKKLCMTESVDKDAIERHLCDAHRVRWFSSNDVDTNTENHSALSSSSDSATRLSTNGVLEIALGCFALAATVLVLVLAVMRRTRRHPTDMCELKTSMSSQKSVVSLGRSGLWNDDVITAKRILRSKVLIQPRLLWSSLHWHLQRPQSGRQDAASCCA